MNEEKKEAVERYFKDILQMEEDIESLKKFMQSKKDLSPSTMKIYDHIEATRDSIKSIKKTMEESEE